MTAAYGPADEEHEHIDDWLTAVADGVRAAFRGGSVHVVGPLEAEPVRSATERELEAANDQIEKLLADLETCRVQRDTASAVAEIAAQLAADAGSWEDLDKAVDLYRAVTL